MCKPEHAAVDAGSDFSWLVDVVVPVGGVVLAALLGTGTALFVQWRQRQHDKRDEDLRRRTELAVTAIRSLTAARRIGHDKERHARSVREAADNVLIFNIMEIGELPKICESLGNQGTELRDMAPGVATGWYSLAKLNRLLDNLQAELADYVIAKFDDVPHPRSAAEPPQEGSSEAAAPAEESPVAETPENEPPAK